MRLFVDTSGRITVRSCLLRVGPMSSPLVGILLLIQDIRVSLSAQRTAVLRFC